MRRTRVGLIGCGKVGHLHAGALADVPQAEFAAACDISGSRAEDFAARYGVIPFTDPDKMFREAGLEVVIVATPHPLHREAALLAASHGVHTLVEKPMAASLSDCDAMIAAAAASGTQLGVISQRRLFQPVARMKQAVDSGKIGNPILGVIQMFSWRDEAYYASDPWRGKWDTEGGGVLVNQAPHQLDILLWLMGQVAEVSAYWSNLSHPYIEVEDTAVAQIRFRSGALGSLVVSLCQKPGLYSRIHVHGSNGASVGVETDTGATFVAGMSEIVHPPHTDIWTVPGQEHLLPEYQQADRDHFLSVPATRHYHSLQISDFVESIRSRRRPMVTGEDGRAVVELFTAIYRSGKEGAPVRFPLYSTPTDYSPPSQS